MSQFIKYVNPAIAKDAEINQLQAKVRAVQAEKELALADALVAQTAVAELTGELPECEDAKALEQALCDAEYDLLTDEGTIGSELKVGAYWHRKFCAKGLPEAASLMLEIMTGQVCQRELMLAIAAHNVAFCRAQQVPEYIAEKKAELEAIIAANPDMDPRCKLYINEILLKACA